MGVSTVLDHTKRAVRVRVDFPIVNRLCLRRLFYVQRAYLSLVNKAQRIQIQHQNEDSFISSITRMRETCRGLKRNRRNC